MVSVRFRPHTLEILTLTGGYYDSNQDYVEGTESWSDPIPCRYEPNGKAHTVPIGEGKDFRYEYTVYLNTDCPDIAYGQHVRLYDADGELVDEYEAKGFHRGQLDAKLWV